MKILRTLAGLAMVLGLALATRGADISGQWTATFDTPTGQQMYTYTFKEDGEKLTGTAKSDIGESEIQNGSIKGDEVSFVENVSYSGMPVAIAYAGKVSGDEITFTRTVSEYGYTDSAVAKRLK
jgi:hypothetical protein